MSRLTNTMVLCIFPLLMLTQCKKYDGGCTISSERKLNKRISHTWKVDYFQSTEESSQHSLNHDVEYYSSSAPLWLPYEIWYPTPGSWISLSPMYYGCNTSNGLGMYVEPLVFSISDMSITFNSDHTFVINYNYNNHEFDIEATNVNCDEAIYKDVSGSELVYGRWELSKNKKELLLTNKSPAYHFPLLHHCINSKIHIEDLCKDKMILAFDFSYTKPGLIWDQTLKFSMRLSH